MQPLFYRPNEFDDWGQIRNADGSMFASVRRPLSEEEAAAHRRNKTDPFEELARRLIASFSGASDPREWAVWWQGSGPKRGDHIMRKKACGLGFAEEVAYIGDRHHDAAHAIVASHNAEIAISRSTVGTVPPLSEAQVGAVMHLVETRLCIIWPKIGAREEFENALRVLEPAPDEEAETCEACGVAFEDGDMVYWRSDDSGHIHAECCGPERESYVNADGEPLKDGEPIPHPFAWRADK